jgi:hypothetical protein
MVKTNYIFLLLILVGCASVQPQPDQQQDLKAILDAQETWLLSLQPEQAIQDISLPLIPGTQYYLEIYDGGSQYQYIKGMYPDTKMLYGLFFKSGRLQALLLEQAVTDFFQCEFAYRHDSEQWTKGGVRATSDWIAIHSVLEQKFPTRISHNLKPGSSSSGTVEAATHLPIAALAAPFYGIYWLSGGSAADQKERRELANAVDSLKAGNATDKELLRVLGPPETRRSWEGGHVWKYDRGSIFFGESAGRVMWKETGRVETPMNPGTHPRPADCRPLTAAPSV